MTAASRLAALQAEVAQAHLRRVERGKLLLAARAAYEAGVPRARIAQLLEVQLRTLSRYVAQFGWRRRTRAKFPDGQRLAVTCPQCGGNLLLTTGDRPGRTA